MSADSHLRRYCSSSSFPTLFRYMGSREKSIFVTSTPPSMTLTHQLGVSFPFTSSALCCPSNFIFVIFLAHPTLNRHSPTEVVANSMSGPHSQGCYPPPGHSSFPAHGSSQSEPPPPNVGTGRYYPPPGYPSFPAHGPTQSEPASPNDGTGRYYPPPGYRAFTAPNHGGPMPRRPSNSGILPLTQYVNKFFL
jgi:hypothetical protein